MASRLVGREKRRKSCGILKESAESRSFEAPKHEAAFLIAAIQISEHSFGLTKTRVALDRPRRATRVQVEAPA